MEIKRMECHNLDLHRSEYRTLMEAFKQWYKREVVRKDKAHVNTIKKAIGNYEPPIHHHKRHEECLLEIWALIQDKDGMILINRIDYAI